MADWVVRWLVGWMVMWMGERLDGRVTRWMVCGSENQWMDGSVGVLVVGWLAKRMSDLLAEWMSLSASKWGNG